MVTNFKFVIDNLFAKIQAVTKIIFNLDNNYLLEKRSVPSDSEIKCSNINFSELELSANKFKPEDYALIDIALTLGFVTLII